MGRIAVVEDHAIVGQALRVALDGAGHDVRLVDVSEPAAIVPAVRDALAEAVVLDLYLGRTESTPLIPAFRRSGAAVIVLTACDEAPQLGDCLEAGAIAVISKVDGLDVLLEAVELALRGSSPMRPATREALIEAARQARQAETDRVGVISRLTPRERLVLQHLAAGRSAEEIARSEFVSLTTVRTHIRSVLAKLGVNSQLSAVALAHRAGWVAAA